MTESTTHCVS